MRAEAVVMCLLVCFVFVHVLLPWVHFSSLIFSSHVMSRPALTVTVSVSVTVPQRRLRPLPDH